MFRLLLFAVTEALSYALERLPVPLRDAGVGLVERTGAWIFARLAARHDPLTDAVNAAADAAGWRWHLKRQRAA